MWSDELPPEDEWPEQVVFTGDRARPWSYDDVARSWYRHVYYAREPDLNLLEPQVREEIQRVLAFWLQLGVDGRRVPVSTQSFGVSTRRRRNSTAAGSKAAEQIGILVEDPNDVARRRHRIWRR